MAAAPYDNSATFRGVKEYYRSLPESNLPIPAIGEGRFELQPWIEAA